MVQNRENPAQLSPHAIVLFDGVCNFCNRSVRFIINRDPGAHFRFAPLQSDLARQLLAQHNLPTNALDSMVLIEAEKVFTRSTASLRIARRLRFPWPLVCYLLIWIPRPLRDAAYNFIARHRYRFFGRTDTCPLPPPSAAQRFLAET